MEGKFQLLIKRYPQGVVSSFVHNLPVGGSAYFKHIPYNIKLQYPFKVNGVPLKRVAMLGAGTGITPLYQALHKLLQADDTTEVVLLYGNRFEKDILLHDELEQLLQKRAKKVKKPPTMEQTLQNNLNTSYLTD